ncbi:phytanoyl-CoA dioxygenase family protein, partial [Candidatus Poribacteria bacterium]|nr:phytanoyl-CoA dioxygenase family protein [Candidatus Poribacteria bacterium]
VEASHKSGRVPDDETGYNGNECKALVCKAGDAILFRSDLWHGALPNCSNERRYMLQVHYGCAYIERVFVSPWRKSPFPENFVDACDDQQRRLLGERQDGHFFPQGSYVLQQGTEHKGDEQWHQK